MATSRQARATAAAGHPVRRSGARRRARAIRRQLQGMIPPITAEAELAQPSQAVFDFLADLRNHALLSPGSVQLGSLESQNGLPIQAIVRLRGPLAIRRAARTAIVDARHPAVIRGRARIGRRTRASITWTIAGRENHSSVSLLVAVEEASFLDGMLLRLGGRRWLQRRFADALARLGDQLAGAASSDGCKLARPRPRPALQPAA